MCDLYAALFLAACLGASTQAGAATVIEARLTEAKWRSLTVEKMTDHGERATLSLSLPQLRVYDADGRLRHDFDRGFSPDTFTATLRELADKPLASAEAPVGLPAELAGVERPDGTPVGKLPKATLVFIEYWADWCQPCHEQLEMLTHFLATNPNLNACVLHVEADSAKSNVGGMPPSGKRLPGPPPSPAPAGPAATEGAAPTAKRR